MKRVLSGLVLIPLVTGFIYFAPSWLFLFLVLAVVFLAFKEYAAMISQAGFTGSVWLGHLLSLAVVLSYYFSSNIHLPIGVGVLITLFIVWCLSGKDLATALNELSLTFFGVFYVAGLLGLFVPIHQMEDGRLYIFLILMSVWFGDSAAYYVGRSFGKSKLAPKISPGKTWEGAVGGLMGSCLAGVVAHFWFLPNLTWTDGLIVAGFCGMIGQFGDLAESVLKRNVGVKDSGNLIPGHGGMLDRVDSLMFAGPAFYAIFWMIR